MINAYYRLTKPGIIYGNLLAVVAGFCLASHAHFQFDTFLTVISGIALIMASGCVYNNYFDRDIDAKMARTKNRALVTGVISGTHALIFATVLALAGSALLGLGTNILTLVIALSGLFFYGVVYSMWTKRHTLLAALIGAISGAVPPVVGYTAVTNSIDVGAVLLFLLLAAWQIPHAIAITIYRENDYVAASVPVLAQSFGMHRTKIFMTIYVAVYVAAVLALWLLNYASMWTGIALTLLGCIWLSYSFAGFWTPDDKKWAKKMFLYSLISLLAFCILSLLDMLVALI